MGNILVRPKLHVAVRAIGAGRWEGGGKNKE
jgi:hypothetical protein